MVQGSLKEIARGANNPRRRGRIRITHLFVPSRSRLSFTQQQPPSRILLLLPRLPQTKRNDMSDRSVLSMTSPPLNGDIGKPRTKRNFMDDGTRRGNVVSAKGEAGPLVGERLLIIMFFFFSFFLYFYFIFILGQNRCNPGTTCTVDHHGDNSLISRPASQRLG